MDAESVQQRLSQIATKWTLVARAHAGDADTEIAAQAALVERYKTAVYRYLLASVRDLDVADELFQEFALRLVRGDFGRANPQRGRFRDYVKTALSNLANSHFRKLKKQPVSDAAPEERAASEVELANSDREFLDNWRKILLDRAWEALAAEQAPDGPPFCTALRFRSEHPDLSGAELVERLNDHLRPPQPFTDAGLRKILQRAREKFTDALVEEVVQ